MPLTDKAVIAAKPKEKAYRLYDRDGLYLEVAPSGGKWWRLKYRLRGKESRISLGTYPQTTLQEARRKLLACKDMIAAGIKPRLGETDDPNELTFETLCREWFKKYKTSLTPRYALETERRLEKYVYKQIGGLPLSKITPSDVLGVLKIVEDKGTITTAYKIKSHISQAMRYAVASGLVLHDPTRDLVAAMAPRSKKNMAAIIDPQAVGPFLRALYAYHGTKVVQIIIKLLPYVFTRPGELRKAEWSEFDFDAAEWRIPAERMKMKIPHLVPLAKQSIELLRELYGITGQGKYLFPSVKTSSRPLSDNIINSAMCACGYDSSIMTGHGFRAMASSLLSELGWPVEIIDKQLAHAEKNKVRAAYFRSEYLKDRKRMMQEWADYLDRLRLSR